MSMSFGFIKIHEYCIESRGNLIMKEKGCFGILDKVFPVGEKDLREIVPECFNCPNRIVCLRAALSSQEGLEMRAALLDRAADRGLVGRLQRWSQKKELSRLLKEGKKKKR